MDVLTLQDLEPLGAFPMARQTPCTTFAKVRNFGKGFEP
jgi:hypothetical protein